MDVLYRMRRQAQEHTNADPVEFRVTPQFVDEMLQEIGVWQDCGGQDLAASIGKGTAKIMGIPTRIFRTGTVHDARSRAWCVWSRP